MSSPPIAPESCSAEDLGRLYRQRLHRFVTAMRNEKADRVPIRPFLAEFCGKLTGYDVMQVTHDFEQAFAAVRKTARLLDVDALVGNMVYVWTGLGSGVGLKYYGIPGITSRPDCGFQYLEPPEDKAWMRPEEYDHLIDDPTGYLYEVWLPRISSEIVAPGEKCTYRNQVALVKGSLAMLSYFQGFGRQAELMARGRNARALCGILSADGHPGRQAPRLHGPGDRSAPCPEKVLAGRVQGAPHMLHTALSAPIRRNSCRSDSGCTAVVSLSSTRNILKRFTGRPSSRLLRTFGRPGIRRSLCRRQMGPASGRIFRRTTGPQHRLPRRSGRCLRGPQKARQEVLHLRRRAQHDPQPWQSGAGPRALPADHRRGGGRGRIHYGRQRHRPGRRPGRERSRDDRVHANTGTTAASPATRRRKEPPPPGFKPTDISPWQTCAQPASASPGAKTEGTAPIQRHEDMVERIWNEIEGLGNMFIYQVLVSF